MPKTGLQTAIDLATVFASDDPECPVGYYIVLRGVVVFDSRVTVNSNR